LIIVSCFFAIPASKTSPVSSRPADSKGNGKSQAQTEHTVPESGHFGSSISTAEPYGALLSQHQLGQDQQHRYKVLLFCVAAAAAASTDWLLMSLQWMANHVH